MKPCTGFRIAVWIPTLAVGIGLASPALRAEDDGEKVYQRALKSVVWVLNPLPDKRVMSGSGSLIDAGHKLVLTNYHVVGDSDKVMVLFPIFQRGQLVPERSTYLDLVKSHKAGIRGKVVVKDTKHDLALVQLEALPPGVVALKLARKSPSPAQRVHSIGNPGSSDALWVYTSGTVRQVYHKKWQVEEDKHVMTFEAEVVITQSPTNPGDSGGPLLNDSGELVAVTQGGALNAQLLSTFIDVTEVRGMLAKSGLAKLHATVVVKETEEEKPPMETPEEKPAAKPEKPAGPDERVEALASVKLNLVKQLEEDGLIEKAKVRYKEIIDRYPNTRAADEARQQLNKLNR